MDNPVLTWVKSSHSSQGNCVEVAARDHVLVRDTKDSGGVVLRFAPEAWRRFAREVRQPLAFPDLGSADACRGRSRL